MQKWMDMRTCQKEKTNGAYIWMIMIVNLYLIQYDLNIYLFVIWLQADRVIDIHEFK